MKQGITWIPDDLGGYADLVQRTEAVGVDWIGVPDSQVGNYRECYVALTDLFHHTTRVNAGPVVSNPLTRHPAVSAAALASVDELSGGRAFMVLGTGDTGVLNLGLRPAKLAQLEEYTLALRDLFESGRARYRGDEVTLKWVRRPVPIYLAADGPRALRLAGRVADGVVVGMGFLPETVPLVEQYLREGAEDAGRRVEDIDVWYASTVAVADEREEALSMVRPSLAFRSVRAFRASLAGKGVPEELIEPIMELQRRCDFSLRGEAGRENPNGLLVEELGLTEYLSERMTVVGTEAEAAAKLRRLSALGVSNIILRPLATDRVDFLDRWERVMKAVQEP